MYFVFLLQIYKKIFISIQLITFFLIIIIQHVKNSHLLGFIKTNKLYECLKNISKFVTETFFFVGAFFMYVRISDN